MYVKTNHCVFGVLNVCMNVCMFVIIELETEENFKNECHPPCHFHRIIHLTAPKCHTMNIQAHIYVDNALKIWVAKKRS